MTVSTGKYYTQMIASSFGTFPNDRLMLGDRLTQVTVGSGSTVHTRVYGYLTRVLLTCTVHTCVYV